MHCTPGLVASLILPDRCQPYLPSGTPKMLPYIGMCALGGLNPHERIFQEIYGKVELRVYFAVKMFCNPGSFFIMHISFFFFNIKVYLFI